jgi:sarcosine oxidase gamma subunit
MTSSSLQVLSSLLRKERDALDLLLARLDEAPQDHDSLLRSISSLELHRAITAREVALELGLDGDPTLRDVVEAAPDEWAIILAGHREALVELASRVEARRLPATVTADLDLRERADGQVAIQRSLLEFLG